MKKRNRVFWSLCVLTLAAFSARAMAVGSDVGDVFPNIRFSDVQGDELRLDQYRGKVVVIKFWGSWCATCRAKWPGHQALYEQLRHEPDIEVLTISFAENFSDSKGYADAQGYTPPLFHGSRMGIIKTVEGEPFQPLGTPYNLVIDRDGTVRYKWIGSQPGISAGAVRELL